MIYEVAIYIYFVIFLAMFHGLFISCNISGNEFLHNLIGAGVDGCNSCIGVALRNLSFPHETPAWIFYSK